MRLSIVSVQRIKKRNTLKPFLSSNLISAEALSEPRSGSDFFGAMTRADFKGNHFLLNRSKRFVVGAEGADFFIVYCRTNFDNTANKYKHLSLLIVDRNDQVKTKYLYGLMGCRSVGTGRLFFKTTKVPLKNLVGQLNHGALYFNKMMIPKRLTSAVASLGLWGLLDIAVRYSDKRRACGQKIREYQGVNFRIADAITKLDAARAMVYMATKSVDNNNSETRRLVS